MPEESKLAEKLEEKQSEITFTEEEMKQVKEIKNNYLSVQYSFGQVKMARIRLDQQEIDLESALTSLQAEEQKFLDGITEKYGDGTLNPETGVFTPNKS
tara:strand:- start:156 stop:452 length:297 start_codon:yes stop_codon:yes gene_type:complete